jgi:plastocyanin
VIRRLLVGLLVAGLAGAPAVEARPAPPKHHQLTKKQKAAKKRRALARKRALAKKRAEAKRKAMEQAAAQEVPVVAPVTETPDAPSSEEAPAAEEPATPAVPLGHSVGITARDTPRFFLQLSRTEVAAGLVAVQVQNAGEDGHDVRIESLTGTLAEAWDELASGAAPVAKDVLLAPGVYRVYCSLPGHAAAGMDTRLTVLAG